MARKGYRFLAPQLVTVPAFRRIVYIFITWGIAFVVTRVTIKIEEDIGVQDDEGLFVHSLRCCFLHRQLAFKDFPQLGSLL